MERTKGMSAVGWRPRDAVIQMMGNLLGEGGDGLVAIVEVSGRGVNRKDSVETGRWKKKTIPRIKLQLFQS